jgi:putative phosphoesterase
VFGGGAESEQPVTRIAAIYDIHGNLPALEAVIREIRQSEAEHVVVGGDVLPGPMPCETIACLRDLDVPVQFIKGNGDREVLALKRGGDARIPEVYREAMQWVADQLTPADEQLLTSWPETWRLRVPAFGDVLFCHASPRNDSEIFTRLTSEERLLPVFANVNASVVVCGHTHMPFDRMVGPIRVLNAGSVGMPFGAPGAYWLLLGAVAELRCTPYDLEAAAARIRRTSYPQAESFADRYILHPPSEAEMLDLFGKAELT